MTSTLKIAALTRKIAGLESLLNRKVTQSNDYITEHETNDALNGFLSRLTEVINVKDLNDDICLKKEVLNNQHLVVTEFNRVLDKWVQAFREECISYLKSACELRVLAEKIPATILVVDDEEPSRTLLKRLLEQKNYQLIFAASGIEALNQLHKHCPDLILMDITMPGMDGLETTLRIKSADQFSTIPIIMVTGNSDKSVVANCLKAGAVDFVVKPFYRDILLEKIQKYL